MRAWWQIHDLKKVQDLKLFVVRFTAYKMCKLGLRYYVCEVLKTFYKYKKKVIFSRLQNCKVFKTSFKFQSLHYCMPREWHSSNGESKINYWLVKFYLYRTLWWVANVTKIAKVGKHSSFTVFFNCDANETWVV